MDVFSVVVPAMAILCLVLLAFVQPNDVGGSELAPETKGRSIVRWHYAASFFGILLLICFMCTGYIEEANYPGGLDLQIFRNWKIWVVSLVPLLYFILNMAWYRVKCKKELTGAFFVVAVFAAIILCSIFVSIIKEASRVHSGRPGLFDGLFTNKNPPPAWLTNIWNLSGIGMLLAALACFLLLWRIRKKQPIPLVRHA